MTVPAPGALPHLPSPYKGEENDSFLVLLWSAPHPEPQSSTPPSVILDSPFLSSSTFLIEDPGSFSSQKEAREKPLDPRSGSGMTDKDKRKNRCRPRQHNGVCGLTPSKQKLIIIASSFTPFRTIHAEVAKLADALDSGSSAPWGVRVQIPPSAPTSLFLRSP